MSKVSVIITVLNEATSIRKTLDNLLSQSRKPDEIVIVDGGSKDGTIEIIEELSKREKTIKLIVKHDTNISEGRNTAIKHAKYPLVVTTDSGCRPDKMWLEKIIEPFETDPSVDAVKGVVKSEPHNMFECLSGLFLAGHLREIDEASYPLSGRTSAFRKCVWEKAGGYPEWLYTGEDTLFHKKLKRIGAQIRLVKNANVYWRPRKTLWKMAKMCYLYGKGNGRIGDNPGGAYYHLRNYLGLSIVFVSALFYPSLFLLLLGITVYFYIQQYRPLIRRFKKVYKGWQVELYGPIIIAVRNFSYSLGLLIGRFEYKHKANFRANLERYLK